MTSSTDTDRVDTDASTPKRAWTVVWLPGLAVAAGAAVATAHGLFEVAVAARVPAGIAWIYPLITDGLALVAYAATARLTGSGARYAWSVVIVSAGLSGLAQASYLASAAAASGAGFTVSPALRFGIGAWPAIAAAVVAHLLYLLASTAGTSRASRPVLSDPRPVQGIDGSDGPRRDGVSERAHADRPRLAAPDDSRMVPAIPSRTGELSVRAVVERGAESPVRDRALAAARRYAAHHGALPTVRELMTLAETSRGTAADALKQLREQPATRNLVADAHDTTETSDPT